MAVLKAIASLYRAREEKPIERYKTRFKVAEEIYVIYRAGGPYGKKLCPRS